MRKALCFACAFFGFASLAAAQAIFHELEGCIPVPVPIPSIDDGLPGFESCGVEGPPAHFNFCCSGLPDCAPFDCCGCDPDDKAPGEQPDGSFHRTSGFDCDTGLIKPRVNFHGVTAFVDWPNTTEKKDDWDRDFTFNVMPTDPDSRSMLVKGNLTLPQPGLHAEIPYDWVPKGLFYLDRGDRVDLFGDWVEDCDHDPKLAEIHPVYGMAISRGLACPRGDQTVGQVFYMGYGPAADGELTLRVFAPKRGEGRQQLHFAEFLLIEREMVSKQLTPHPEAEIPYVEVKLKTMKRPGQPPGRCEGDEPSWNDLVRNLALNYHALVAVWWEGPTQGVTDLVPTLTDACHGGFTVQNAGTVPTPATTATVTGAAGIHVVAVPPLAPGDSIKLKPPNVLECEGTVTVTVDPNHSIPSERFFNNTVTGSCIC
jgi:hypothetical protein